MDDIRRATDLLGEWEAVEDLIRAGTRLRLVLTDEGGNAESVASYLRLGGVAVGWAHGVEPSVEDIFVSFVDKERKARLREQLKALSGNS